MEGIIMPDIIPKCPPPRKKIIWSKGMVREYVRGWSTFMSLIVDGGNVRDFSK